MFRINWVSLFTGATGQGEAIFTESQALEIVRSNNEKYPDITHSMEKYEAPALTVNVKGHRCSYGDLTFVATGSPSSSEASTPSTYLTPKPSGSQVTQPSSSVSSALPQVQVSQQQSSPPPSDFSTSFF